MRNGIALEVTILIHKIDIKRVYHYEIWTQLRIETHVQIHQKLYFRISESKDPQNLKNCIKYLFH